MKIIHVFFVAAVLLVSSCVTATTTPVVSGQQTNRTTSAFTHTVFIEEGTATWCPNCPDAAEALYSLYNSTDYPFYYVALVYDQSKIAKDRMSRHYRGFAFPTIFVDGGFNQTVGSGSTPQQTEQLYRPVIEKAGAREVHPLEMTTTVTGNGDATLDITVTVKNIGEKPYLGFIRCSVTEIVSRWNTQNGHPYHFALLDYALKKIVYLPSQKTQTYTATFDGAAQHGNLTFPDITDDNILVISSVSHWQPHLSPKEQYVGMHLAFYVDQVSASKVIP